MNFITSEETTAYVFPASRLSIAEIARGRVLRQSGDLENIWHLHNDTLLQSDTQSKPMVQ